MPDAAYDSVLIEMMAVRETLYKLMLDLLEQRKCNALPKLVTDSFYQFSVVRADHEIAARIRGEK